MNATAVQTNSLSPPIAGTDSARSSTTFTQSVHQPRLVQNIKAFGAIELLARYAMRVAIITAIISIISWRIFPDSFRIDEYDGWVADLVVILCAVLSTALFVPCGALIDAGLCGYGAYSLLMMIHGTWRTITPTEFYLYQWSRVIEWTALILIGFLRILVLGLACADTYYYSQNRPNLPLKRAYFNLIVRPQYDWWCLKPLPLDFLSRTWYKRLCRPWFLHEPPPFLPTPTTMPTGQEILKPYLSILFGTWTFHSRRGEKLWFVILRGIAAIAVLATLAGFSMNVLALQPSSETAFPSFQFQRLQNIPLEKLKSYPIWGVLVGIDTRYVTLPKDLGLSSLISVTAEVRSLVYGDSPSCWLTPEHMDHTNASFLRIISYDCGYQLADEPSRYPDRRVQITISADYAGLGISRANFTPEGSIMIWPRFTRNIPRVLESTNPTILTIGTSVIASVGRVVQAKFAHPTSAMFGVASDQYMYLIGHVSILGVDPFMTEPDATRPDGFASLRLIRPLRTANFDLYSETRQHTVLAGLSALGGLSAFLNLVFVFIFGGSIMLVLFDTKPLSTFGLLHKFSKASLERHFRDDFSQIRHEGGQPGSPSSGLVTFIREYFMDFSALDLEEKSQGLRGQATETPPESMRQIGGRSTVALSHAIALT